ncbi:glycoside hydrolase family 43 protein [Pseudoxanthomonas dokdonensis]|nr:glycoside hydrolase family 43 protein [Pseudoxanthomonas dokdonensis]
MLAALLAPWPLLAAEPVLFDWFQYHGDDAVFATPLPDGSYRNPVLAGFHPDPSITRAGDRFYLVNSSFAYFPGIPVFESQDLVHWKQIGNVIDRPSQLDFDGLGLSRGVFAPAIEYHDGVFYVVNTAVDSGGNFLATASNPAGPWSDPIWLPTIDGIDPSLFFDDDGRVYLLNNDLPEEKPRYDGHRAIWLQAFDLEKKQPFGPRKVLIDGGVDPSTNPIWIEGPHLLKRDGWYYLNCAEGGTGPQHSQVILRSRDVWGPYTPSPHNPILTQRDLPDDRPQPITNAGHADLVQGLDGQWWATFLASRNYGGVHYNTGRETFLLPVEWKDGWPMILPPQTAIPYVAKAPTFMHGKAAQAPLSGNFSWRDEFDGPTLGPEWMYVRVPKQAWVDLDSHRGQLAIRPLAENLDSLRNPSLLVRRQQHMRFEASTAMQVPTEAGTEAGIVAFQNEDHWLFMGVRRHDGQLQLFLRRRDGGGEREVASRILPAIGQLQLKITGDQGDYGFAYDAGAGWQWLQQHEDGSILSTDVAGGFVGAVLGPYARIAPQE